MARHAYWTHASVGLYNETETALTKRIGDDGLTFVPNAAGGAQATVCFPLPTPVIVAGARSRLVRVFVLYELGAKSVLGPVVVRDGPNHPGHCDRNVDLPDFGVEINGPLDRSGRNCLTDLVDNVTRFNYTQFQPQVFFGLALFVTIGVGDGGFVRFTSVGADYEIG
jgi:hypothetical protein